MNATSLSELAAYIDSAGHRRTYPFTWQCEVQMRYHGKYLVCVYAGATYCEIIVIFVRYATSEAIITAQEYGDARVCFDRAQFILTRCIRDFENVTGRERIYIPRSGA